ncbi:MAG: EFR1 family ferrodoxin [Oscillospiraceae bacterium]|nr:EFR1 family ferrodoxin [Oscillospiraceae bacterium]
MATIYCFTSTGNSLYAANQIASKIGGTVLPMKGAAVCDDDVIGFVFPNYFWGLPRMVERFANNMRITSQNAYVFAVITCGGPAPNTLGPLKKILERNHVYLSYGAKLRSVTNYLPGYEAKDSEALRAKVAEKIARIAKSVANQEKKRIGTMAFPNNQIHKFYPGEDCDKDFSVAPSCSGCAVCQKVCPAGNIALIVDKPDKPDKAGKPDKPDKPVKPDKPGKPDFQHKCEHCLACLHNCPAAAIDWKNKTQGKERYRNANVSLDDLIAFNSR